MTVRDAVSGETGRFEGVQVDVFGTSSTTTPDTDGQPDGNTGGDGGTNTGGNNGGGQQPGGGDGGGNNNNGGGQNPTTGDGGGTTDPPPIPVSSIEGVVLVSPGGESDQSSTRGVRGISIYLDTDNNGLVGIDEPRVTTSTDGTFRFDKIPHGDYAVRMVPSAGWIAATPETRNVNLRSESQTTTFAVRSHRDFGDAPFPYSTTQADGGAFHAIDDVLYLGDRVDPEPNGTGSNGANYDDVNGSDDEDGIVFNSSILPGSAGTLTVTASKSGFLQGWIDYNADGDWNDPGEQIIKNRRVPAGASEQVFIVPSSALLGTTYARFRIANQLDVRPNGMAFDGEVEDYVVLIGE